MSSASAQHVTRRCRALRIATPSQIREMGLPELRKLKFLQPESLNAQASAGSANAIPDEVWNAYLYRCSLLRDEFLPGDVAKLFHVLGKLRPPFLLKKLRKRHSLIELGEDHDDEKLTGGGCGEGEEKTQAESAQFEKKSPPATLALVERSRVEDFAIYMLKNGSRRPDRYRMSDVALIYNACQKLHISSAVVEEYKKLLESCIFRRCNDKTHLKDLALLCHAFPQDFVHLIRLQEGAGGFAFTERFLKRFFKEVSYRVREFYPEKCAEIAVSQCVPAEVGQTMLRQLLQVVVGKRTKVVPQKQAGGGPGISSSNKIKHNDAGAETESGTDRHFAFERHYYENYDVKAYDKTRIVQILEPFVDNEQWLGDCLTRGRLATAVHQILKKS
eukprot:g3284.t1